MAKPSRRARQELKLPRKKGTPSASSLEVARRASSTEAPREASASEVSEEREEREAPRKVAKPATRSPSGASKSAPRRAAPSASDDDDEPTPGLDAARASKGRAVRFIGVGVVIFSVLAGVAWLADRKPPTTSTEPGPMPSLKPGDQVKVFDPEFEKSKAAGKKPGEPAAAPKVLEPAPEPGAAPTPVVPPSAEAAPAPSASAPTTPTTPPPPEAVPTPPSKPAPPPAEPPAKPPAKPRAPDAPKPPPPAKPAPAPGADPYE